VDSGLLKAACLAILIWAFATARAFFIPVCIAALLASLLSPLVRVLKRARIPELIAVSISAICLLVPFLLLIYGIVAQGERLVRDFPAILAALERAIAHLGDYPWARQLGLSNLVLDMESLTAAIGRSAGKGIAYAIGGLSILATTGTQILLILSFTIAMVASRGHLRKSVARILSSVEGIDGAPLLDQINAMIQRFLGVRLLVMVIIGGVDVVILRLFGLGYAFLLGTLCGVMTVLPYLGFALAMIPVLIVAIASGYSTGPIVGIVIALLSASLFESYVLTPKLVGHRLNVNVLFTLIGLFAGGLLWGLWGVILSVPFLGILRIVLSSLPSLQPWGGLLAAREAPRSGSESA
jgi:predicted PurR-regulated permease PerM